jgi:hypothetical protein
MCEIPSGGVPSPDKSRTLEGGNMQITTMTASALEKRDNAQQALGTVCLEAAGDKGDMKHSVLFERVSARLKAQVGPDVYASWFARLKLHSHSKSVVRLTVPTTFLKSWINNRYLDLITSLFQAEDAEILKVEILVRTATRHGVKAQGVDEQTSSAGPASVAQLPLPAHRSVRRCSALRSIRDIPSTPMSKAVPTVSAWPRQRPSRKQALVL